MQTVTDTYNGWKNYETWATALWISNDRSTYDAARELTETAKADADSCEQVENGIWTVEEARRYTVADSLKYWVEEELLPDLGATLAADLLKAAVSEINWYEIADAQLED